MTLGGIERSLGVYWAVYHIDNVLLDSGTVGIRGLLFIGVVLFARWSLVGSGLISQVVTYRGGLITQVVSCRGGLISQVVSCMGGAISQVISCRAVL